jgi:hypothetical protein
MRAPSTVVREPTRSGFVEDVARGAGSTSPDIPGVWSRSAVHRRPSLGLSIAPLASGGAQTFRVTMVGARIVEHYGCDFEIRRKPLHPERVDGVGVAFNTVHQMTATQADQRGVGCNDVRQAVFATAA